MAAIEDVVRLDAFHLAVKRSRLLVKEFVVRERSRGLTLVELLIVVGIIALLISILLPSLNKARRNAMAVQCLANERSIGQAMLQYSLAYKNAILPCVVYANGGSNVDFWAHLLVAGRFLPDPNIPASALTGAQASHGTVLVCPVARDVQAANDSDGFTRVQSSVVQPASGNKPALIVDMGYGINSYVSNSSPALNNIPSTPICYDGSYANTPLPPVKKLTQFHRSSQTVLLYDGFGWNQYWRAYRITGLRHGIGKTANPYDFGTTNLLFMDWHAEAVPRKDLPTDGSTGPIGNCGSSFTNGVTYTEQHFDQGRQYMRSPKYIWSLSQDY